MNKKAVRVGVACGIMLGATIITYAITTSQWGEIPY